MPSPIPTAQDAQETKQRILQLKDFLEARINNMRSKGDGPASPADPADYRNLKKSLTVYIDDERYYFQTGINKWYCSIDPGIFYSFSDLEKRRVTRHGFRFAMDWSEQTMEEFEHLLLNPAPEPRVPV